ncbi:MAG: type II secretion system protein GspM [Pyrinomonadaceae bacterium]
MKQAIAWWRERSERERWMVGGTIAVVLALIVFLLLWQPLNSERLRLAKRVPELRATLQQMQAQAREVKGLQARPKPVSLEVALDETAREIGLPNLKGSLQNDGPDRVRANFKAVEFNKWVAWMGKLQNERAIRLDSAQVEALPESGMVKINSVLTSSAARP